MFRRYERTLNVRSRFAVAMVFAIATLAASPAVLASPITYDWTVSIPISAGGTITGSGQLVADGNLTTSITGTYGGSAITGLAPVNTYGSNDNLVFPGQSPLLTTRGISFFVSPNVWTRNVVNIFHGSGGYTDLGPTDSTGAFTLTASSAPEPATVTLLAVGALAGAGLRKLRRNTRSART